MEIIIQCSDDMRGATGLDGTPIQEIVRCKECKHWANSEDYDCEIHSGAWSADDYCSYGEARGE